MGSQNIMHKSLVKGIFISNILLLSLVLTVIPSDAHAEEINVTSIALDETVLVKVTNDSDVEINTIRIWVGSEFSFESFKTQEGWVGEKTPQGVLVFTSSEPIKSNETVKFGVKTNKITTGINWKALDKENNQVDTGKVIPTEVSNIIQNPTPTKDLGESMSTESTFRVVPDKPNVGSTIRVTGDKFGASQEFDFYMDSKKIGSFETDQNGHFMTTMKIPEDGEADRVDFKIKDKEGEERKVSIRLGEIENRSLVDDVKLTVKGIPSIVHRGDILEVFGTAQPSSGITAQIVNSDGEIINTRAAEVDSKGNWKSEEEVLIPLDTPFGDYSATISDGREEITVSWTVESDKIIDIKSSSTKYEAGETFEFSGIGIANESVEIVLEDPLGNEIFSDIIQTNDLGEIEFEFKTKQTSIEGTYTVIVTQEKHKEFVFVGLGERPNIPVKLEFDKLNYKSNETAILSIIGKSSEIISLLIIDPSDKPKGDSISITLQADGRATHSLDLKGYSSGVYTAVISKGSAQSSEVFTVGLQVGSGEIEINTTKVDYNPGDSVLILGDTNSNILLDITMNDSDGNEIKTKETFSDKDGKISENSFRIPSDAKSGIWTITAKSGPNFHTIEIEILALVEEGMIVSVTEGHKIAGIGESVNIQVFGGKHIVDITIVAEDGEIIEELAFPASSTGEINQPWIIPADTEPGTYTIKVSDAFNSVETTFEIE